MAQDLGFDEILVIHDAVGAIPAPDAAIAEPLAVPAEREGEQTRVLLRFGDRVEIRASAPGVRTRGGPAVPEVSEAVLQELTETERFGVEAMHTVEVMEERVSSSAVREALAAGNLEHAAALLGHPYCIAGRVVHGDKIGRKIGWPTANIQLKRKRLPLTGVFAVTVSGLDKRHLPGAASLGVRPTLGLGLKPVLEVNLFDFDREIYGSHITVHFLHKMRDEMKFDSLDALTAQIGRDVKDIRNYFEGN